MTSGDETSMRPLIPDYAGACTASIVPTLLEHPADRPDWFPEVGLAERIVLVVLDGLGWEQLDQRRDLAPTMTAMTGGRIWSVLPTTTATALTSIATGATPGEHGIVGYRIHVHGEVLNILRWTTAAGDARQTIPPQKIQQHLPFLGHRPPVITRTEFAHSGFTAAHLDGVRFHGWRMPSTIVTEVRQLLRMSEPFVYAYYDGIDKVSHEYGIGEHYDAEVAAADRLVADIIDAAPSGTAVVVTSDHGQVHTGANVTPIDNEVMSHVSLQSGEGRFRWLHARPGHASALIDAATSCHGRQAWIRTRDQVIDEGWFGPQVTTEAASRLGDVALVAHGTIAFTEPTDTGPYHLVGRHGSATPDEIYVPLLAATA